MDFCISCLSELVYVFLYVLIAGMTSESYCTALRCIKALAFFVRELFSNTITICEFLYK